MSRRDPNRISLLVRNLPLDARPDEIRMKFEKYGEIRDVYLPRDYYSGRARGFGFIEFRDPRDAEEALYHLDRSNFMGREISVVMSKESRKTPRDMIQRERVSAPRGHDRGHGDRDRYRDRSRSRSRSRSPRRHSRSPRGRRRGRSYSRSRSPPRDSRRDRSRSPARDSRRGRSRSRSRSRSPRRDSPPPARYDDEVRRSDSPEQPDSPRAPAQDHNHSPDNRNGDEASPRPAQAESSPRSEGYND